MKIKYLKLKNWLLVSLAGLLGINLSCVGGEEYGCPEARFNVKGKVTDPNGTPIPGIQVEMGSYGPRDTTDAAGQYSATLMSFPETQTFEIGFTDIDGTENGLYKNDTVPITFQRSELTGGDGHWYEGSATKTLNVTLQPVEE